MKKKNSLTGRVLVAHFEPTHIQKAISDLENSGLKITKVKNYDDAIIEADNGYDLIILSSLMFGFNKSKKHEKIRKEEDVKVISELVPHLKEVGKKIIIIANHPIQATDIITDPQCLAAIQAADLYSDPDLLTKEVKHFFNHKRMGHENHKNNGARNNNRHTNRTTNK